MCCDVDVLDVGKRPYYGLALYIWVFAHKSVLRLPKGGVRTDAICANIDQRISGSRLYGMGKLELDYVKRFAPMADYTGKVMRYVATDFYRLNDLKQPVPSNRKAGV